MGAHGKCETLKLQIKENVAVIKKVEKAQIAAVAANSVPDAKEVNNIIALCEKNLNKTLTGIEKEWIRTWVSKFDVSEALVTRAFEDNLFRTHLSLKNIHDTLSKWNEKGIRTVEAADKFCEAEHNANIRKAARKSSNKGAVWKTGAEAGLFGTQKTEVETKPATTSQKIVPGPPILTTSAKPNKLPKSAAPPIAERTIDFGEIVPSFLLTVPFDFINFTIA